LSYYNSRQTKFPVVSAKMVVGFVLAFVGLAELLTES